MRPIKHRPTIGSTAVTLHIYTAPHRGHHARLICGNISLACQIGRHGTTHMKREGDGKTPMGRMRILQGFWRDDRKAYGHRLTATPLIQQRIRPRMGWCDDPQHPQYNKQIIRPFKASHEEIWREDDVYNLVLDLNWNRKPAIKGRGSAIFFHLSSTHKGGTAGCIAVDAKKIHLVLQRLTHKNVLIIH